MTSLEKALICQQVVVSVMENFASEGAEEIGKTFWIMRSQKA